MPKRQREPPREVSPLRDRFPSETDDEYKQYTAQCRKLKEKLRDGQRDRSNRSRPKRKRELAERQRRDAAANQIRALLDERLAMTPIAHAHLIAHAHPVPAPAPRTASASTSC